jgi:hypothetical protein
MTYHTYKQWDSLPVSGPLPRDTHATAWTPQQKALRATMPLLEGYAIGLEYCPKNKLKSYQAAWKHWMGEHPDLSQWPYHLTSYIEKLKREGKRSELLDEHLK